MNDSNAEIIEHLPWGIVLWHLDDQRIEHANATARQLIGDSDTSSPIVPRLARVAMLVVAEPDPGWVPATTDDDNQLWIRGHVLSDHRVALFVDIAAASSNARAVAARFGIEVWEARLLARVMRGFTNAEIADKSKLPIGTVKTRLWRLYRKLGVRNRTELVWRVTATARARN